jgi:hypothetical protein
VSRVGGWLLRWGLPRDPAAVRNLIAFAVTSVTTVLVTRALLALSGYPQLGGNGLHIAHVLWGGLLMGVALVLLASFAGPVVRPLGVLVGGIGFGLFLDEIGKFVTSDNDYFYRPAVAIMYVVVVGLLLVVHWMHGRRPRQPTEYLAAGVDAAVAGAVGGFTVRARADALRSLAGAGDLPGAAEARALIAAIPFDAAELPDLPSRMALWLERLRRLPGGRWPAPIAVALLVADSALTIGLVVTPAEGPDAGVHPGAGGTLVVALASASAVLSALLVVTGLVALRASRRVPAARDGDEDRERPAELRQRSRLRAFRLFRSALLISILVTKVFQFVFDQWTALGSTVLDLLLFAVIAAERARLARLLAGVELRAAAQQQARTTVTSAGSGSPPS